MGKRTRRTAWVAAFLTLATIMTGGYTVAAANATLDAPEFTDTMGGDYVVTLTDGAAQEIVDAQTLPTAVGYLHQDTVWANSEEARPLASISKVVSVLVTLEHAPLDPDTSTWGTHTWTSQDWRITQQHLANYGVAFPLPVGTEIALEDMMKLIFLPSANDMVAAFAYRTFGTNEAFITAVEEWAAQHQLETLRMAEPSGMSEQNVASPADALRIGRMALEHPVISQFISMDSAHIPGIGLVENTNPLIGNTPGVIGVKTGRSSSAGFNLIVAQERELDDRSVTQISVTMGRGSLAEREQSGRDMLALLDTLPQTTEIINEGTKVGTITDWQGNTYPVTTAGSISTTLLPGESVTGELIVELDEHSATNGVVGEFAITSPLGITTVPLTSTYAHIEPTLWWRMTHPGRIFS